MVSATGQNYGYSLEKTDQYNAWQIQAMKIQGKRQPFLFLGNSYRKQGLNSLTCHISYSKSWSHPFPAWFPA